MQVTRPVRDLLRTRNALLQPLQKFVATHGQIAVKPGKFSPGRYPKGFRRSTQSAKSKTRAPRITTAEAAYTERPPAEPRTSPEPSHTGRTQAPVAGTAAGKPLLAPVAAYTTGSNRSQHC